MDFDAFISGSTIARSPAELQTLLLSFVGGYGFSRFVAGEISCSSRAMKEKYFSEYSNYPDEWRTRYLAFHYIDYDPVYRQSLLERHPFSWASIRRKTDSPIATRVMDEAQDFGLRSGIGLSILEPSGSLFGFGFASPERELSIGQAELGLIYASAFIYHEACSAITAIGSSPQAKLTERERDILCWIARGKTKTETADRLAVSESCIKRHCENIALKLETTNLPSAVAKAIHLGLIDPF